MLFVSKYRSIRKMSFEKSDLYKLKFENLPEYLFAQVGGGKDSLQVSKDYWYKALTECQKLDHNKLLIEEDLDGVLYSAEIYEFSVWLAQQNFNNTFVAFVDLRTEHLESNQLSELIANNRGFFIKVFPTTEAARNWLVSF